jgi:hypothetical protein
VPKIDDKVAKMLQDSLKAVGQIDAIVVCKQHPERPGKILSGRHRAAAGAKRRVLYDVDEFARRVGVGHEVAEQIIIISANVQRHISKAERRVEFLELAARLEKDGVPHGRIVGRVVELTGFTRAYVHKLIPEFKSTRRSEAIKRGLRQNVNRVDIGNEDAHTGVAGDREDGSSRDNVGSVGSIRVELPGNLTQAKVSPMVRLTYDLLKSRAEAKGVEMADFPQWVEDIATEFCRRRGMFLSFSAPDQNLTELCSTLQAFLERSE